VADITAKGGVPLDDAQLKVLIVGKSISVRNAVTGEQFKVQYERNGQYLVRPPTGKNAKQTSEFGNLMQSAQHEQALGYSIQNGMIFTMVGDTVFQLAVYKQGNKYIAARGSEFGYANYEIVPQEINLVENAKGKPSTKSDVYAEKN
jgi:hypothetical protein